LEQIKKSMLQDVDIVKSGDRSSHQRLKFENMSPIRGQKNPFSRIKNQTTDIAEVASGQDLSISSVDRGALPLRPQDGAEQINSRVALRPDITSRPVIQDAQVTHLRLEMGINMCAVNCNPDILLLLTASEDHGGNIIHGLLENGADFRVKDSDDWTPLHKAAESGRETVVRLLLGKGADVSAKENIGRTPLH
jgi:ankyrin repeat protein